VLEVSSFQLEVQGGLKPRIGVLLNLQPDHLDRHGDMATYTDVKTSLFAAMGKGDKGVAPVNLVDALRGCFDSLVDWRTFGAGGDGAFESGEVTVAGKRIACGGTLFGNPIMGEHLAAAAVALESAGASVQSVEQVAKTFEPLPHRMNRLGEQGGVMFVNDSKSTTMSSIGAALQMCRTPVRLIAGGLLKEKNTEMIKELLAKSVAKGYLIGTDACRLATSWRTCIECEDCETLAIAVSRAWSEAQEGETILLSPGCASFDQFRSFEDRGSQFAGLVEQIKIGVAL
jgi:UDP-N-acetylmuramoylalanine--D-glutamate ligase